jgi:hypothetical protein
MLIIESPLPSSDAMADLLRPTHFEYRLTSTKHTGEQELFGFATMPEYEIVERTRQDFMPMSGKNFLSDALKTRTPRSRGA